VLETNRYLLDHGLDNSNAVDRNNTIIVPPVHIHPSAQIERAIVGPYVTVAAGCKIQDAIIRDSIIDEGSEVRGALLEHSLIGRDALVSEQFDSYNVGDSSSVGRI